MVLRVDLSRLLKIPYIRDLSIKKLRI